MPGYQWLDFMLTEWLGKKELPNVFFLSGTVTVTAVPCNSSAG